MTRCILALALLTACGDDLPPTAPDPLPRCSPRACHVVAACDQDEPTLQAPLLPVEWSACYEPKTRASCWCGNLQAP